MTDNAMSNSNGIKPSSETIPKQKHRGGRGDGKGRGGADSRGTNHDKNPQGDAKKRRGQNQKNKSVKTLDTSSSKDDCTEETPKFTEEELQLKAEKDALAAKEAQDAKMRATLLADKEKLEQSLSSKITNISEFVSKIQIHKSYRSEVAEEALKASRLKFTANKSKLKSDLKKCTAFIRKVKSSPTFDATTVKSLINDLDTLNLTRYLEEIAQGLVENKSRKVSDVMGVAQLCHALHVRYDNWMDELSPRILSILKDKSSDPKHRRIIVRLMAEMILIGIGEAKPVLKVLADAAGSPGTNGEGHYEVTDANMITSIVKSGGYELIGIIPSSVLKDVESLENISGTFQNHCTDSNSLTESDNDTDASKTLHLPLAPSQKVLDEAKEAVQKFRDVKEFIAVPSEVSERFQKHLNGAFTCLSILLVSTHKKLSKMKKRCAQDRLLAGTLPEQREKALEDAIQLMDSIFKSVEVLADALDQSIPELIEEVDEIKEDTTKLEVYKGEDGQTDLGPFDDEDTKDFYCNIPDLLSTIPPVLLGYKDEEVERLKGLNKVKYASDFDAIGEDQNAVEEEMLESEETFRDDAPVSEDHFDMPGDGKSEENETDKDTPHFKLLSLIEDELPECNRRDKVDALAEKFCTTHGAVNKSRKRLEKAIFLVPRSRLDLIPYYSRLSAILDRVFPDMTSALVTELEQQFHGLAKWKKQSNLETRVRNTRFIGELTKFRVAPPIVALRCFSRCLDDFSGHNVDIACCLLESCGRFLFKTKHTSAKISKIMETMDRIRKAKHFDERTTELIKSSFYIVKPPQIKTQKKTKVLSPVEAYIKDLFLVRLDMNNINFVSNQILRLPWNDEVVDFGSLIVKYMLKTCRKGRYKSINAIAALAGKLKKHKNELIARLIDTVFEELQFILENPNIRDQQRAITYVKLLGELHTQMLVPVQAIIDELYHFINFDHEIPKNLYSASSEQSPPPTISSSILKKSSLGITQPIQEDEEMAEEDESNDVDESTPGAIEEKPVPIGVSSHSIYDPRVPSALDPPSAVFRIKLICTLLDCSASSLVSATTANLVNNFLSAFQRYLFIKQTLPTDIEFSLLDTFDILESRFRTLKKGSAKSSSIIRYNCWLDSHNAVVSIEEADSRINERTELRLLTQAGLNTSVTDDDEAALEEDVPLDDDDDSYDNSVDTAEEEDISLEESEEEDDENDISEEDSQIDNEKSDEDSVRDCDEEDEIVAEEEYMRQMEDEAFEREIRMLTMDAIEKGKVSARTTAVSKVSDSMPAASQFNRKKLIQDSQEGIVETNSLALSGNDGISFQLIKRGNKGKAETKSFIIPKDTNLAKIATTRDTAADRERDMLKARVLQYEKESESTRSGDVYFDQPKVKEVRNRTLRSYDIDDEFGRTSMRPGHGRGRGSTYGGRGSLSGRGLKHF